MGLTMQSRFAKDWEESCFRRCHTPGFLAVSRAALWLWLPLCYAGMLIAPAVACGILLQALHSASLLFWGAAILSLAFLAWGVYRTGRGLVVCFHARVLNLEVLLALAGFILGLLFTAYTLATGFYFHP